MQKYTVKKVTRYTTIKRYRFGHLCLVRSKLKSSAGKEIIIIIIIELEIVLQLEVNLDGTLEVGEDEKLLLTFDYGFFLG